VKFLVSSVTYIDDIPQSQSVRLAQKALQEDDVVEELSFTERQQVFFRHNTLRRQFIKSYHDDGDLLHPSGDFDFLYYIQEIKLEVSSGGSDPFVEAIHYWQEQIRACFEAQKSNHQEDLLHANFPAIILLQFGEYFTRPLYVQLRPLFQDHI